MKITEVNKDVAPGSKHNTIMQNRARAAAPNAGRVWFVQRKICDEGCTTRGQHVDFPTKAGVEERCDSTRLDARAAPARASKSDISTATAMQLRWVRGKGISHIAVLQGCSSASSLSSYVPSCPVLSHRVHPASLPPTCALKSFCTLCAHTIRFC